MAAFLMSTCRTRNICRGRMVASILGKPLWTDLDPFYYEVSLARVLLPFSCSDQNYDILPLHTLSRILCVLLFTIVFSSPHQRHIFTLSTIIRPRLHTSTVLDHHEASTSIFSGLEKATQPHAGVSRLLFIDSHSSSHLPFPVGDLGLPQ